MASWLEDVVQALDNIGGEAHLDDISREVVKIRSDLPDTYKDIIRRVLQESCSETKSFKNKEDLFFSAAGLGKGVWGLNSLRKSVPEKNLHNIEGFPAEVPNVYIANFGEGNSLWPKVKSNGTIATFSEIKLYDLWNEGQRKEFIAHATQNSLTAKGLRPVKSVAGRWYNLIDELVETNGDLWISKQGDQLWWTISKSGEIQQTAIPSGNLERFGPNVYFLEKRCSGWSNADLEGRPLLWKGLHPKARDFLSTEATFQRVANDRGYADFAKALVQGVNLDEWYDLPIFKAKQSSVKTTGKVFSAKERMAYRLASTMEQTVKSADGSKSERGSKIKNTNMTHSECSDLVIKLYDSQEGLCAYSGIKMELDGQEDDKEMLSSLDRIDSEGHYTPQNLQLVCRFINRWKSNDEHELFARLISKLQD